MKKLALLISLCWLCFDSFAQEEKEEKDGGFKKENLFTGGSISLSFFNNTFLVGGNPVFGYSLTDWADAGLVINYTYASIRDYSPEIDKVKQHVYGGGGFLRLFPLRFLFVQGQFEHNWIKIKATPQPGYVITSPDRIDGNSLLVGGGYTNGREGDGKTFYGYFAVLFDITKNQNSPYLDASGRAIPIVRAGIHVPLFQGGGRR
jgi:hypothetical protein